MLSGRIGEGGNSSLLEEGAYPPEACPRLPWIGGGASKGLGELALEEASNLQGLEEEIENGNSIQQHGTAVLT